MRYEVGMVSFLLKKQVVEMAVEKGAASILMLVSCRSQLLDLSDDMATNADIRFHADTQDAV